MSDNRLYPLDGESLEDYISRMREEKSSLGATWQTIADIANESYDKNYNECTYRKGAYKKEKDIEEDIEEDISAIDEEKWALRKLKEQIREERIQTNANIRALSREETIKEIARYFADKMNEKKILPVVKERKPLPHEKTAILNIGDWHYGIDVDNAWNKFNPKIAEERVAKLTSEAIRLCKANNVSHLIVNGLGDYINGLIHLPLRIKSREDVITQSMRVSEMVAEMVAELSQHFFVDFYTVFGNHGRIIANKKESLQIENIERMVPWHLAYRMSNNKNVVVHNPDIDMDMTVFDVNGFHIGAVHGDKDCVSQVVRNLTLMTRKPFDLIITAHKHHLGAEETNNCLVITNPSLIGVDEHSKDLRLTSTPAQTLIIVGEDSPIECMYYISLQ